MILTFGLTVFAWIFFRAENIGHAISYISEIFSLSLFQRPTPFGISKLKLLQNIIIIILFITIEWFGREGKYGIEHIRHWSSPIIRLSFYIVIAFLIFALSNFNKTEFIYFAF